MHVFRALALAFAAAAAAAAPAAPAYAAGLPSLEYEYFQPSGTYDITQFDCNPGATSTVTATVTGDAGGPYPGTFSETVTVVGSAGGELVGADATYEIRSGTATITGAMHLVPSLDTFYSFACSVTPSAECEDVWFAASAPGDALGYDARIASGGASRSDRGYADFDFGGQAVRCAGDLEFPSGWLYHFFTRSLPGSAPAAVTLSPASATALVDSYRTVTAAVVDDAGAPVAGAVVRLAVSGASRAAADCRTDGNGTCELSYYEGTFPGTDALTAYVDVDGDGTREPGEPATTAAATVVLPTSTPGQASGGGRVVRNQTLNPGPDVTFSLAVRSDGTSASGQCSVVDPASGTTVRCDDVLSYVQRAGGNATIYGHATVNGARTLYRIYVESGYFTISTQSGFSAGGPVTAGSAQVR